MPVTEKTLVDSTWYKTERNTEALLKAVASVRAVDKLSGEDLWYLLRLTWITANKGHVTDDHWRSLKVPALSHLFDTSASPADDLNAALNRMQLPHSVLLAARRQTGFVNAYRAYRNSLKDWCLKYKKDLRPLLHTAANLGSNDQDRFDLAAEIEQLHRVPTPEGIREMAASNLVTPLIACLDPKRRFPIINGEKGVLQKLAKLGLVNQSLEDKVKGFIGLIGHFGIEDAFAIDTMTDDHIDLISKRRKVSKPGPAIGSHSALSSFDEAERKALQEAGTITYRNRHNRMTNRLQEVAKGCSLSAGTSHNCKYDVLVTDYDNKGRDLLIEAKPDPDMGSIRVAIGQLFDYRRFLPNQAATDLAILTILPPSADYVEFMQELQITCLWFTDDKCSALAGQGKVWAPFKSRLSLTHYVS